VILLQLIIFCYAATSSVCNHSLSAIVLALRVSQFSLAACEIHGIPLTQNELLLMKFGITTAQ
jgi:hypothetical protein